MLGFIVYCLCWELILLCFECWALVFVVYAGSSLFYVLNAGLCYTSCMLGAHSPLFGMLGVVCIQCWAFVLVWCE